MTPERARAVALEGPRRRKKDTKANNVGSVQQEERGTGGRAAGQAPAPGVWASMADPGLGAVQEGRGPGPRGGNTEGEGVQPEEGVSGGKGRGAAVSGVRPAFCLFLC